MNELAIQKPDPAIIAAAEIAKAKIHASYQMALYRPRSELAVRDSILASCKNREFAKESRFKIQGKGEGFTIRFAEAAMRAMGNIYTDYSIVYEDDLLRRVKVSVIDLETNMSYSKEIVTKKTVERKKNRPEDYVGERKNSRGETVYILKTTDEEFEIKAGADLAKALRTEGLRLIPPDIKSEAKSQIAATMLNADKADPKAAIKAIVDSFSGIGVRPDALEKYLKQSVDSISPAQMSDLRQLYKGIRDGETTWADTIADQDPEPPKTFVPIDTEGIIASANDDMIEKASSLLFMGGEIPGKNDPEGRNKLAKKLHELMSESRKMDDLHE